MVVSCPSCPSTSRCFLPRVDIHSITHPTTSIEVASQQKNADTMRRLANVFVTVLLVCVLSSAIITAVDKSKFQNLRPNWVLQKTPKAPTEIPLSRGCFVHYQRKWPGQSRRWLVVQLKPCHCQSKLHF